MLSLLPLTARLLALHISPCRCDPPSTIYDYMAILVMPSLFLATLSNTFGSVFVRVMNLLSFVLAPIEELTSLMVFDYRTLSSINLLFSVIRMRVAATLSSTLPIALIKDLLAY